MNWPVRVLLAGTAVLGLPAAAWAGMPSITLTDVARLRLQSISFFLMLFLLSAGLVQLLWNYLRRDFMGLPRLSYPRALAVVGLWGLLFVLVLTMISGARELMTPGAWVKDGLTYKLAEPAALTPAPAPNERYRREKLQELKAALWDYARSHNGQFPPEPADAGLGSEKWQVPHPAGMRYLYAPDKSRDENGTPLVYEPGIFGEYRLVLLTDGQIMAMTSEQIQQALGQEQRR